MDPTHAKDPIANTFPDPTAERKIRTFPICSGAKLRIGLGLMPPSVYTSVNEYRNEFMTYRADSGSLPARGSGNGKPFGGANRGLLVILG